MPTLQDAARLAYEKCMELQSGESVLIVTDVERKKIADAFLEEGKKITSVVDVVEIPIPKSNGMEPPAEVAAKMKEYDVVIMPTSKSISHTDARRNASASGARIASLPMITEEIMCRAMYVDYEAMYERTHKVKAILDAGKEVRIITPAGTDVTMSIEGHRSDAGTGLIAKSERKFGNLPAGEAFMAPVEGSTNGKIVVDGSFPVGRLLENPFTFIVKDGFVVGVEGGAEADAVRTFLEELNDPTVYNIAELGIGTNDKAKLTGITLEDEKIMKTVHIAVGDNTSYHGGTTNSPTHMDGVLLKPTVWVDGKKILEEGEFLI